MQSITLAAEEAAGAPTGVEAQLEEAAKLLSQAHVELQQKNSDLSAAQAANAVEVRSKLVLIAVSDHYQLLWIIVKLCKHVIGFIAIIRQYIRAWNLC